MSDAAAAVSLATVAIEEEPRVPQRIVFEASVKTAERIALALDEEEETAPLTVALFDLGVARVESSIYLPSTLSPEFVLALIGQAANGEELGSLRVEPLEEQDWVKLSQEKRGAVRAGRFIIHGSHEREQHSRYAIEIDAGQAFGTAHHASTQGCLMMLDHISKRRRFANVLDLGTGAGTLAIAASRLGLRKVLASDSDRIAVGVAAENAKKNRAGALVDVMKATGLAHQRLRRAKFDLIFANILFRPLFELAPLMARRVRPRGSIILSGITEAQAAALQARYISLGFVLKRRVVIDGWTSLLMAKRR
jgi:ribosomal protein L11 methyltransferase